MSTLDNIDRVASISHDRFWREYVLTATPLVITGLFDNQPLRELDTQAKVVQRLGSMRMAIRYEYTRSLARALAEGPHFDSRPLFVQLSEYWDYVAGHPDTSLMCVEDSAPAELRSLGAVPALCTDQRGEPDVDLKSNMFVGNAGNYAPIHFDGDYRHVLLYQLFGRKRVVILCAERSDVVRPIVNFGTLQLQNLGEPDKLALLQAVGARDVTIHPGEAVFIPALAYHYVEYLDHGMSQNFRFGRNRHHGRFSTSLHLDAALQYVAHRTLCEAEMDLALVERIVAAHASFAATPYAKYCEMAALFRSVAADLGRRDTVPAPAIPESAYALVPEVVRACLLRLHLFNERLYRPHSMSSESAGS